MQAKKKRDADINDAAVRALPGCSLSRGGGFWPRLDVLLHLYSLYAVLSSCGMHPWYHCTAGSAEAEGGFAAVQLGFEDSQVSHRACMQFLWG